MLSKISGLLMAGAIASDLYDVTLEQELFLQDGSSKIAVKPEKLDFYENACQFTSQGAWYNYQGLQNGTINYFQSEETDGTIAYYDLCEALPAIGSCDSGFLAEYDSVSTSTCTYTATSSVSSVSSGQFTYENGETNFALTYTNNDECLTVVMLCDTSIDTPVGSPIYSNGTGSCANYTELAWSKTCPIYSINSLVTLLIDYKWIVGIVALVFGFFFTFFGLNLIKAVLFICGVAITIFGVLVLFYATFMKNNDEVWAFWLIFSLSAVAGIGVGILMVKGVRFGAAILCAWGGFMLGVLLNETWLYIYGSQAVFWCVSIAIAIICAGLAFVVFEHAVICITAFLGAYFMARGLAMFVGGFPSAFELVSMVEDGAITTIDPVFYGYLAGILVLWILGSFVQYKIWIKRKNAERHPYDALNN